MKLTPRFERALAYAARLHAPQVRKGGDIPYIAHLLGTAAIALSHGASEDEAIAALLHDAAEDQGGLETLAEIRDLFGDRVAAIVSGCSDALETPKPPWRQRKEAYIAGVRSAAASVRLVSAADKLDNARAILADLEVVGVGVFDRFRGGRDGTLWYYRELIAAFRAAGPSALVDELDRVVVEIERRAGA